MSEWAVVAGMGPGECLSKGESAGLLQKATAEVLEVVTNLQ